MSHQARDITNNKTRATCTLVGARGRQSAKTDTPQPTTATSTARKGVVRRHASNQQRPSCGDRCRAGRRNAGIQRHGHLEVHRSKLLQVRWRHTSMETTLPGDRALRSSRWLMGRLRRSIQRGRFREVDSERSRALPVGLLYLAVLDGAGLPLDAC